MSDAEQLPFDHPRQEDVRLNQLAKNDNLPWWEQVQGAPLHLPMMESWRQYSPEEQVAAYEFLLRNVLDVASLEGKVTGYEDIESNFDILRQFEGMADAMHNVSHKGDRDPVRMRVTKDEPGERHIETFLPPYIVDLYDRFVEEGWPALAGDPAYGGSHYPHAFANGIVEMSMAANPGFAVLLFLSEGVAAALESRGSEALKQAWLPRLRSGEFTGAMVMTEPNFGSSLSDMETTLMLDENGDVGKVYGYKRFLSSADHNATVGEDGERRIMHMVLARTADHEGNVLTDEKGRPSLTLALVPRVLLNEQGEYIDADGNMLDGPDTNAVRAVKLNDKMGLQVQSNSDAAYDGARAFVVGKVGEGLKNMFIIMNEARIGVGLQGVAAAELTHQNVNDYVTRRRQGPGEEIVNYPNVQEKLLTMRAHIDAGRMIAAETALALDIIRHGAPEHFSEQEKDALQRYVDVMTPMVKWGLSRKGDLAVSDGVQAMGGEGYMEEAGIAQIAKDTRIARIYEGANDVLAVAMVIFQLKNMDAFIDRMREDLEAIAYEGPMQDILPALDDQFLAFEKATSWLQGVGLRARGGDEAAIQKFQAAANPYMELMYGLSAGVALARQAEVAMDRLQDPTLSAHEAKAMETKIATADFYANAVLEPERGMHVHKMHHSWKHLNLPDHEIEKDEPTFMQRGAETMSIAAVRTKNLIDGLVEALGLDEKGRG